jgi:hypothetical protein
VAKRKRLGSGWSGRNLAALAGLAIFSCENQLGLETVGIVSVDVAPVSATVSPGDTIRFLGTASDENGVGYSGTAPVWTTSDPRVAAVAQTGLVTAIGSGTATISAKLLNLTGTATVDVVDPPFVVLANTSLGFAGTMGGTDPADQVVSFSNGGSGTLSQVTVGPVSHSVGEPGGWLTADVDASSDEVVIRVSVNGLGVGTYNATVGVGTAGSVDATLSVSLVVT